MFPELSEDRSEKSVQTQSIFADQCCWPGRWYHLLRAHSVIHTARTEL